MKIGFDLDRVFINYPPVVPPQIIDWLYKRSLREILSLRKHYQKTLSYTIPNSPYSKAIRKTSHLPIFRPAISQNIKFIKNFSQNYTQNQLFLISSRYKFLEKLTHQRLSKLGLSEVFSTIYLNTNNKQPHLFKEEIIKKNKIELYIDDDLSLLQYLYQTCPNTKLLWYNPKGKDHPRNGIITISNLSEIHKFIK